MYLISYMRVGFGPCKGDDDFVLCSVTLDAFTELQDVKFSQ